MQKFKDEISFQKWVRSKKETLPDVVEVAGVIYTMDHYDRAGKELTYGNKRNGNGLVITTENRYSKSGTAFKNAVVESLTGSGYYHCVEYID